MSEPAEPWFCYMVRCRDSSIYIGIAKNVEERVKRHNWGVRPEYTARRRPVKLVWSECFQSSEEARGREKEIKGWSREKKLRLMRAAKREEPFGRLRRPQGKGE